MTRCCWITDHSSLSNNFLNFLSIHCPTLNLVPNSINFSFKIFNEKLSQHSKTSLAEANKLLAYERPLDVHVLAIGQWTRSNVQRWTVKEILRKSYIKGFVILLLTFSFYFLFYILEFVLFNCPSNSHMSTVHWSRIHGQLLLAG